MRLKGGRPQTRPYSREERTRVQEQKGWQHERGDKASLIIFCWSHDRGAPAGND